MRKARAELVELIQLIEPMGDSWAYPDQRWDIVNRLTKHCNPLTARATIRHFDGSRSSGSIFNLMSVFRPSQLVKGLRAHYKTLEKARNMQ